MGECAPCSGRAPAAAGPSKRTVFEVTFDDDGETRVEQFANFGPAQRRRNETGGTLQPRVVTVNE